MSSIAPTLTGTAHRPRPGGCAGHLVSAAPLVTVSTVEATDFFASAGIPALPCCDIDIYKLSYLTSDESGALVTASGALAVPLDLPHPAPVVSYQHGTTTLSWDVASTAPVDGNLFRQTEAILFGSAGYLTVLPDYLGYGESGHRFHPYLHADTLAGSVVDLLTAARAFCADRRIEVSDKLFLAGYSEGGYATMAATMALQDKHPEIAVTASAPMAGPYDLSGTLREILAGDHYPGAGYLAFAFWAYDRVYSLGLLDRVIAPPFVSRLDELFNGCNRLVQDDVPALPNEIAALFRDDFLVQFLGEGFDGLKSKIRENDLHDWRPAVPLRLIHSRSDDIVAFHNSLSAFRNFERAGAAVHLLEPPGEGSHSECALPAMLEAMAWFDTLK